MKKKILVVDDQEDFRILVVRMLTRNGFETIQADNGINALEQANAHLPDLIISDVMMYSGSGFILRELLKKEPQTAKIPLILISAMAQDTQAWGLDAKVDYLSKPITEEQLISAVRRKIEP